MGLAPRVRPPGFWRDTGPGYPYGIFPGRSRHFSRGRIRCVREAAGGVCDAGARGVSPLPSVEAPGEGVDAVLREQLADATHEEATLTVTYVAFLAIATMLAACGVMLDNAILIVGAMAAGPEFGPLAGISTALVQRSPGLVWRSLTALVVGFAAPMLLTSPGPSRSPRPSPGALIGVAISVTTVPAAAHAAMAFSYQEYAQTWGSSGQFLANLGGIVLAGVLSLLTQKSLLASVRRRRTPVR